MLPAPVLWQKGGDCVSVQQTASGPVGLKLKRLEHLFEHSTAPHRCPQVQLLQHVAPRSNLLLPRSPPTCLRRPCPLPIYMTCHALQYGTAESRYGTLQAPSKQQPQFLVDDRGHLRPGVKKVSNSRTKLGPADSSPVRWPKVGVSPPAPCLLAAVCS